MMPVLRRLRSLSPLLGLLLAAGCSSHPAEREGPAGPTVDVSTARVTRGTLTERSEAGGVIQARQSATLTSRVMAPVSRVLVTPGDIVRAGQVLVTLDTRDLTANSRVADSGAQAAEHGARAASSEAEAADAALALAQASYDRIAKLAERKSATPQELDEATATLRSSRARLAAAKARLAEADASIARAKAQSDAAGVFASYGTIAAPFAGRITEKLVEPGNMASPGTPLLRLESTDGFRVHVRIDESRIAGLTPGQTVESVVATGADDVSLDGTVAELARAIDADARAFLVKIDLSKPASSTDLRTGMFARVLVPGGSRETLLVPATAIVRQGQVTTVFVVENNVARLRIVQTGAVHGDEVEVLAGLDADEQVVVAPPTGLIDGRSVRATAAAGKERS